MLGLYSLCSYVLDKSSSRSVYLGVCPVLFAHYLRLHTAVDHGFNNVRVTKYIKDCYKHLEDCVTDEKVGNGKLLVKTVVSRVEDRSFSVISYYVTQLNLFFQKNNECIKAKGINPTYYKN